LGKIARAFQIRRQRVDQIVGIGLFPLLVREEVEQLVLLDRIADRAAPDVRAALVDGTDNAILECVRPRYWP
jgi:hypothetical protein